MSDLFDHAESRRRRDAGLTQVESHGKDFAWRAYSAIEALAAQQPSLHIDDVLRQGVAEPPHPNAWGAVWMRAIRAGLIERTADTRPSADRKKHAHRYPVYRSLIWRTR